MKETQMMTIADFEQEMAKRLPHVERVHTKHSDEATVVYLSRNMPRIAVDFVFTLEEFDLSIPSEANCPGQVVESSSRWLIKEQPANLILQVTGYYVMLVDQLAIACVTPLDNLADATIYEYASPTFFNDLTNHVMSSERLGLYNY